MGWHWPPAEQSEESDVELMSGSSKSRLPSRSESKKRRKGERVW